MLPSLFSSNSQDLHTLSDAEIQKKSKFKYFNDELTPILNSFEKTKDWPDLIKLLQKLQKAIKKHMAKCPVLPQPYTISKRLSQCLNPKLPAGVHKQCLVCYEAIFESLKETNRLPKSFGILFNGIFSFYPLATIQIKPQILNIFKLYILPLDELLIRPILPGLVASLVIAMEEDVVEFQVVSMKFVNNLKMHVGDNLFLQALFEGMLNASRVRIPGFKYLESLYKNTQLEEAEITTSLVEGKKHLALNMLLASVRDEQVMAQRLALEFLSTHFPIDSPIFGVPEKVAILTSIFPLLLRKDVSLSRRVFKWMFAGKMYSEDVFDSIGKIVHVGAFKILFQRRYTDSVSARQPFQIILTILDKIPQGKEFEYVNPFLFDIIQFLHIHSIGITAHQDILKSAICVFEKVQIHSVWNTLYHLVKKAETCDTEESLQLLDLVGSISNLLPENMDHTTQLLQSFQSCLRGRVNYNFTNYKSDSDEVIQNFRAISTCLFLFKTTLSKIQSMSATLLENIFHLMEVILEDFINNFVKSADQKDRGQIVELYTDISTFVRVLQERVLNSKSSALTTFDSNYGVENKTISYTNPVSIDQTEESIPKFITTLFHSCFHNNPAISVHAISMIVSLMTNEKQGLSTYQRNHLLFETEYPSNIARRIWNMLIPELAEAHYEIVRYFYQLYCLNPTPCNTLISKSFYSFSLKEKIEAHTKFSLMWRLMGSQGITKRAFDDGVLRMLESIKSDHSSLRLVGRSWLFDSCSNVSRILDPLFLNMLDQQKLLTSSMVSIDGSSYFDESRSRFILHLLEQIVTVLPRKFLSHCLTVSLTDDVQENYLSHIQLANVNQLQNMNRNKNSGSMNSESCLSSGIDMQVDNYFTLLVLTCLRLMDASALNSSNVQNPNHDTLETYPTTADNSMYNSQSFQGADSPLNSSFHDVQFTEAVMRETLRTNSVILLRTMLSDLHDYPAITEVAAKISESILLHLQRAVRNNDSVFQVEILSLLRVILSILNSSTKQDQTIAPNLSSDQAPIIHLVHSTHFLPTLLQGIQVANQAQASQSLHSLSLLTYWVNHIIASLPYLHTSLPGVVTAIIPTLCDIVKENALAGVDSIRSQGILISLHGMSMLTQYCIVHSEMQKATTTETARNVGSDLVLAPFKFLPGVSNVTDFFSNVFTQEIHQEIISPAHEAKQFLFSELSSIVETLAIVWKAIKSRQNLSQSLLSISHIARQSLETAIVEYLRPLSKSFGQELILAFVDMWARIHPESTYTLQHQAHVLDIHIVDFLNNLHTVRPEDVISYLVKIINSLRSGKGLSYREGRESKDGSVKDFRENGDIKYSKSMKEVIILHFLHNYLKKCVITDNAQGVSQNLVYLFRITLGSSPDIFTLNILLKILYCYFQRWPIGEEKRNSQPFKEITQRLLEACLQICVKEMHFNQSSKNNSSVACISTQESSVQLLQQLSSLTIDILLKVFEDRENIISFIQAMMQPLVVILKNHQLENTIRHREAVILLNTFKSHNILHLRAIRKELFESFFDGHFFKTDPDTLLLYKSIFSEIIKEGTFQDLLSKFQRQVGSIFLNRDSEIISRGRNIKRLSFLYFSSGYDEQTAFLHPTMEKLVDSLKITNNHPHIMVHSLFCIRVLFARFSSSNFSEFWPVIISILMQLLGNSSTLAQPEVLLEAIKLVDYAIICQAEPFQAFKWIFLGSPNIITPTPKYDIEKQFVPMINGLNISSTVFHNEESELTPLFEIEVHGYDDMELRKPIAILGKDNERVKKAINSLKSHERYEILCSSCFVDRKELDRSLARDFSEFSSEDLEEINRSNRIFDRLYEQNKNPDRKMDKFYDDTFIPKMNSESSESQWNSVEQGSPLSLLGSPISTQDQLSPQ